MFISIFYELLELRIYTFDVFLFSFKDKEDLQLGSLSHYIRQRANGYEPLPDFPEVPPSGEFRNVEPINKEDNTKHHKHMVSKPFIL